MYTDPMTLTDTYNLIGWLIIWLTVFLVTIVNAYKSKLKHPILAQGLILTLGALSFITLPFIPLGSQESLISQVEEESFPIEYQVCNRSPIIPKNQEFKKDIQPLRCLSHPLLEIPNLENAKLFGVIDGRSFIVVVDFNMFLIRLKGVEAHLYLGSKDLKTRKLAKAETVKLEKLLKGIKTPKDHKSFEIETEENKMLSKTDMATLERLVQEETQLEFKEVILGPHGLEAIVFKDGKNLNQYLSLGAGQ